MLKRVIELQPDDRYEGPDGIARRVKYIGISPSRERVIIYHESHPPIRSEADVQVEVTS